MIDAQMMSPHLASLGAFEVAHIAFSDLLKSAVRQPTTWGIPSAQLNFARLYPKIHTERLVLRPLSFSDAATLFPWMSRADVNQFTFVEPLRSVQDAERYLGQIFEGNYRHGIPDPYGICLKGNEDCVIGTVGCFRTPNAIHQLEFAADLSPLYHSRGYASEAAWAMIDFVFENFAFERLQVRCALENHASAKFIERLGMHFEGISRRQMFFHDQFWDLKVYSMLRDEWVRRSCQLGVPVFPVK
jgi:ribosomal-protein-alanine N-acetyltransferase